MTSKRQSGFTLVELMIAMVLGLLVTAAVLAVFIQAKRSSIQNNGLARMQENARFAMQILSNDLKHADYFADLIEISDSLTNNIATIGTDCTGTASPWVTDLSGMDQRLQYQYKAASANAKYSCIDDSFFKAGTNILAIKRLQASPDPLQLDAAGTPTVAPDKMPYMRTNGTQGFLYYYDSSAAVPGDMVGTALSDWRYQAHIYYVGPDHVLYRQSIAPGMNMQREALIEDVEYFHVQFGIDDTVMTELDGVPNYYTSDPGTDIQYAVAARIWLLMRAAEKDATYKDTNTYHFGDPTTDGVDVNAVLDTKFDDSVRHRVYTTTVRLENVRNHFTLGQ